MLRTDGYVKRIIKQRKRKERHFIFKLRYMRKIILNLMAELEASSGRKIDKIIVRPEDFIKLSLDEIQFGFDLMKKNHDITGWTEQKSNESLEYMLMILNENRSELRILDRLVLNEVTIDAPEHKTETKIEDKPKQTKQTNDQIEGQLEITAEHAEAKSDELLDF